ncbi:MAG TPA: DUF488 domain-containing protein [Mucilaginibacter sp.]|nr:DUF488 domain-containing protein [Mucilaginibacter sp.]
MTIKVKRIYEPYSADDGYRILVDRLWPRGMKKEDARIDKWLKEIAPSTALRKWFNHEPDKWEQFRQKYHDELNASVALDELLADLKEHKTVTFLFSSKEEKINHAVVLKQFVADHSQS